jgi:uncharacterized protein with PIN domain
MRNGDRVSFYPMFESFDVSTLTKVREKPLRDPRFVLDVHLGKLANHLRMLGFDTLCRSTFSDEELLRISLTEKRTLLTKDLGLLRRDEIERGYHVRESNPRLQIIEVLRRFDLVGAVKTFTRCIECNDVLKSVEKQSIIDRLPPKVKELYDEFVLCNACDRVYWKGSHYQRMREFGADVLGNSVTQSTSNYKESESSCWSSSKKTMKR